MDRNRCPIKRPIAGIVALRKESVDRNTNFHSDSLFDLVALRKESVDRNDAVQIIVIVMDTVALRKESVDRNNISANNHVRIRSRSPQGERG